MCNSPDSKKILHWNQVSTWDGLLRLNKNCIRNGDDTNLAPRLLDAVNNYEQERQMREDLCTLYDFGILTISTINCIDCCKGADVTFLWKEEERWASRFADFLDTLAADFTIRTEEFTTENFELRGEQVGSSNDEDLECSGCPKKSDYGWLFNVNVISTLSSGEKLTWYNLQCKNDTMSDYMDLVLSHIVGSAKLSGLGSRPQPQIVDLLRCHEDAEKSGVITK